MPGLRLRLPPAGTLTPIGTSDPLRFYYKPLVGRLFRARIDAGLGLLEGRVRRLLEVGYGSGLLLPTLAGICEELYGVDLEPEPPGLRGTLETLGARPRELVQADVRKLPFPQAHFDAAVAFSIFEHLKAEPLEQAAAEMARVLERRGLLVIGCPAVHRGMALAFSAIGFHSIDDHHFSGIGAVLRAFAPHFELVRSATLPRALGWAMPLRWAPYATVLVRRR